jgi:AcrR family transcriptional regulator
MTARGQRGPYSRTKERREAIADAALAVVMEQGHRALTTLTVAQRAGMSEPGLLYHFPSKDAVLVAALARFDALQISPLAADGEVLATAPARAAANVRRTNIARLYAALMVEGSDPDHPAHDYLRERGRAARAIYTSEIQLLQTRREVPPDVDARRAAAWLLAAYDGLQNHWLVDPEFDLDVELRLLIDVLLMRTWAGVPTDPPPS